MSVRSAALHVARLDDLHGEIRIDAERMAGDRKSVLYRFALTHDGRKLIDGRAVIALHAGKRSPSARGRETCE